MAEGLDNVFIKFTKLAGAKTPEEQKQMNAKACGKMVKDCLPKEMSNIVDASVFPKFKEKGKPYMMIKQFPDFIRGCAHEYAKIKTKNSKLPENAPEVQKYYDEFLASLSQGVPNVHEVKISKTGNVEGLTDTSAYTGTHKERFDEEGKGRGMEGRVDRQNTSGYVADYKGEGTYDKS